MQITDTVLMVRPAAFAFNAETAANNYFQNDKEIDAGELQQKALHEFDAMSEKLKTNKINVIIVEDTAEPQKPDAIFPNNWFSTHKNGKLYIYPMFAKSRRLEKRDEVIEKISQKIQSTETCNWSRFEEDEKFLEGTGSMILDRDSKIIYACISPRTHPELVKQFADENNYKAIVFNAADEDGNEIYHTNVMMCIGETFAVVCADAIVDKEERKKVLTALEETVHEIITISFDQMKSFAGNMLQLKNRDEERFITMSKTAFESLTEEQKHRLQKHGTILDFDVSLIEEVEGGSVRCMMAEIFL